MKIKVEVLHGVAYIDGRMCSFETKEIRSIIEEFAEVNKEFILPKKYDYVVTELNGFAKIIESELSFDKAVEMAKNGFTVKHKNIDSVMILTEGDIPGIAFDLTEIEERFSSVKEGVEYFNRIKANGEKVFVIDHERT